MCTVKQFHHSLIALLKSFLHLIASVGKDYYNICVVWPSASEKEASQLKKYTDF